jgi:hypothetical protein
MIQSDKRSTLTQEGTTMKMNWRELAEFKRMTMGEVVKERERVGWWAAADDDDDEDEDEGEEEERATKVVISRD